MFISEEVNNMTKAELSQAYDETWDELMKIIPNEELFNILYRFKLINNKIINKNIL